MDKSIFKRESIHDTNMRQVIVRLDYSCNCDGIKIQNWFDDNFRKSFLTETDVENHEVQVSLNEKDFESISKNLSIPVQTIKDLRFVRYEGMKKGACDVIFDMSQCYMCLTITCHDNYDGLTEYVQPLKGAITLFKKKNIEFIPRRLGVRKIRVERFATKEAVNNVFEPFVYNLPDFGVADRLIAKSEYVDVIEDSDELRFNIRRSLSTGVKKTGEIDYTATLDIDAYYHEDILNSRDVNGLLKHANEREFEIYRECMTIDYLRSINER